ncbi:nuclear transport factor 2 family protein [Amycolatopsis panacis]|uniref:Nuclear transport factor 2 family protein n=1 Tax=Amycolatopsis panacis TaxID=2340917 RepID=A0A419I9V1_9PSEU|nr:nuclear transport factor 2 family protein [Amycolatopsis panacis]RJQ89670.1 nuclear transport factor 2 family protein [Amycolatopsis panacis]
MNKELKTLAADYLRHLENREWSAARALCTENATVWHSDGKGDQTIEENVNGMKAQISNIEYMRYTIVRQLAEPGEVLQQHIVHVASKDGMRGEVHAAVYFRFEGDLIARIEEYANFVPAQQD